MEPITHFLTGACIGRAGLNRKTACATIVATLAAEAADLDIVWGFRGPVANLQHHRGITHTFIGAPVVAAVVVGVIGGFHLWRQRRKSLASPASSANSASPALHWGWLYLTGLIASLSHILLDWTNNYGVRPFFPFNPRWYAGSFVFIAEPVWWALLLLALIMPALFGLADREIGARRTQFRGRGWAIFALLGMTIYGCWRWAEHARALSLLQNTSVASAPVSRVAAEPFPVNPWRWHAILETPAFYQTAEINTRTGAVDSDPQSDILYKPADTPALEAAKQTYLGRVYLDWSTWPVVRDLGQEPVPGAAPPSLPPGRPWTTIEFTDLRFAYAFRGEQNARPPSGLSGWVYILDNHEDGGQFIGGREQK
ncbi:metal-dependent hydrolase [Occallatibacter riparius]|uniref:Metal-dependent hydrolase n=1 Tax=Occallatibacter riparius TaxID=1002689 RepID=A0A9J7BV16_9BACT|nr:metal-dependent hydrolase [Occallatibacter riparius]UWZ86464.1 metal-dependent hydrolase [Occallatibacter riparius]